MSYRQERWLVVLLAAINFTHSMDFVIMMPLGPQLMRSFQVGPDAFGWLVSSYTFSAAVSGFLGVYFLDRFDRKPSLLAVYSGFIIGTVFCGLADSYFHLLLARILAGAFGGLTMAIILAIVGDLVPEERRGTATGIIFSAFSIASILGVPLGLVLAHRLDWHWPFLVLGALSLFIVPLASRVIPSVRGHLGNLQRFDLLKSIKIFRKKDNFRALIFSVILMFSAFTIIPYIAPYLVANVGVTEAQLPLVYLSGGLVNFFSSRWIGRLSDRHGKPKVFRIVASLSIIPILLLTNLVHVPLVVALATTTLFMILMSGRFVPAMAIITSVVPPSERGSFMSLNSSLQQATIGIAASVAGSVLIVDPKTGEYGRFWWMGIFGVFCTLIALWISLGFPRKATPKIVPPVP